MNSVPPEWVVRFSTVDTAQRRQAEDYLEQLRDLVLHAKPSDSKLLGHLGESLFRIAFPSLEDVNRFAAALNEAVDSEMTLRVWIHADDAGLSMLPWEYLCMTQEAVDACKALGLAMVKYQPYTKLPDEQTFLALHPNVSLVRQPSAKVPTGELQLIGPLRVLIAWADPGSRAMHALDRSLWPKISGIDIEIISMQNELRGLGKLVESRELAHATKAGLEEAMRQWRPHVLHFAGHGAFPGIDDPGDLPRLRTGEVAAALVLEAAQGDSKQHDYVTAEELRPLCAECGVQLVVLNNCWGGHTSPQSMGIAQALTGRGAGRPVPVVVAHQSVIPQSTAIGLVGPLYQNLAVTRSVEDGIRTYRSDCVRSHEYGCGAPDWGIPVVYLGVRDSRLFTTAHLDPYPIRFGELVKRHAGIVGREFVRDAFADFKCRHPSGTFLMTGPPGTGKTAFVAQCVLDNTESMHYFFRETANVVDPDECVKSLYFGLLAKYRIVEEDPTKDAVELRRRLAELLSRISERCARQGKDEVIFIDALDESGKTATDGKTVIEVLPAELPPRVYLFVTSRPVKLADRLAARCPDPPFVLDPRSGDNLDDAAAFCRRELGGRLVDVDETGLHDVCRGLAEKAEGNFLVLKIFVSRESLGQQCRLAELEEAARNLTGDVEKRYEEFLDRLQKRYEEDLSKLELLYGVLGAFSAAEAPVTAAQVCRAFGLKQYQWEWAFGIVCQFLERSGIRREEGGELPYRIYHETFREFLLKRLAADLPGHHRRWAEHCRGWRELKGYDRLYALRHLPTHSVEASRGAG